MTEITVVSAAAAMAAITSVVSATLGNTKSSVDSVMPASEGVLSLITSTIGGFLKNPLTSGTKLIDSLMVMLGLKSKTGLPPDADTTNGDPTETETWGSTMAKYGFVAALAWFATKVISSPNGGGAGGIILLIAIAYAIYATMKPKKPNVTDTSK